MGDTFPSTTIIGVVLAARGFGYNRVMTTDQAFASDPTAFAPLISTRLWLVLLALGWLLLELTADPVFVVIAACSKFGWEDMHTAFWLRRRDPERNRGRTHFWFYIANGLWKVTMVALGLSFVIVCVAAGLEQRPAQQPLDPPKEYFASIGLGALALFLSAAATWIAVAKAWWGGVKLWVDSTVHQSRTRNVWPPQAWGENRAKRLVLTAFLPGIMVTIIVLALFLLSVADHQKQNRGDGGLVFWLVPALMLGVPIALLALQDQVMRIISVASPTECWGGAEEDLSAPFAASLD
jgi:hypothetical protein